MTYDASGNLSAITNAENETTSFTYTARGEVKTITDPLKRVTRFSYDAEGNVLESINAANEVSTQTYDGANRLISTTDSLNRTLRFEYDSLDRMVEMRDAMNGLTTHAYDANDNLISIIDPNQNSVERNVYDLRNRLIRTTDAKNLNTVYEYDLADNVTAVTDRRGGSTQYTFDALNRITSVRDADGRMTAYAYDVAGNIVRVSDTQSGDILMSHDRLGRLVEVVSQQGSVSYSYDVLGRRMSRSVAGGDVTSYTYDKADRLKSVTMRGKTVTYNYDIAGRLIEKVLPNGIKAAYEYDAGGRLTSIQFKKPDNTVLEALTYSYDPAGQRISKATGAAALQETPFTATYDAGNRLTSITLAGETFTLAYDGSGNLISKSGSSSGTTSYTWNARNQLAGIAGPGVVATFKYDAFGRRTERIVNGESIGFLYDDGQAIAELRQSALRAVYHTGAAIDEVLATYGALGDRTLLSDALMSVIAEANDDHTLQGFNVYSPYGETTALGGTGGAIQYTSRENDGTGLYYYRARYYDPMLKRFISEDPSGIDGGLNLFAYVNGDPVLHNDPLGLFCQTLGQITIPDLFARKVGSTSSATPWYLFMTVVSPTASRLLRGWPGGRVDCYAKRTVTEVTKYEKWGTRISWGYCVDECGDVDFWSNSREVLLDQYSKTKTRTENKTYTAPISAPVAILGQRVCRAWAAGLN
jgi:RHS repeat-associated protein